MSTVIQVSNLSKIYRLGEIGTGTISRDLERWKTKGKKAFRVYRFSFRVKKINDEYQEI